MSAIEKFDTASVAPRERLHFWNELAAEIYAGTYVNAPAEGFKAEMWRWTVGDLAMIRPRSAASVVGRAPVHTGGEERVILHFQRRGSSLQLQRGRDAEIHAGDFALCSVDEPYLLDLHTGHELLVVEFPRAALDARVAGLEDRLARRIPGGTPSGRLLHDFLLSLWQQGDQSHAEPAWQRGVSNVFFDLLGLAVNGADAPRVETRLRDRVLALVDARLADPALRTTMIADELGISPRTVQNVFAELGTTPSGYIQDRRLERAADRLATHPEGSITELAYDLGFNDSAYFARCFRQHFGTTPSAWRGHH
ncbi:MAG: helix-turn-helix domain-containing protein [Sphingomonadaceae bacterium]|nr:helix-turn-helix domain-containing protein [Sphingomonadaceae bacterium]